MRLIDADKLDWWYKGRPIRRVIDEAPTVDAVPVVRCKNCAFKIFDKVCQEDYCNNAYGLNGAITDNSFCSYGEMDGDSQ